MMKSSKYNYIAPINEELDMLYNVFTGYSIVVDHEKMCNLKELKKLDNEEIESLYSMGILIDDDVDEIENLKKINYQSVNSNKEMTLVIQTTSGCNFACPYCYQSHERLERI